MKNIKITEANREKIAAAIKEAEGRATARTATAKDLFDSVKEIENRLSNLNVPKNKRKEMSFRICPEAQKFPGAYKWNPEATCFWIIGTSSGWNLILILRDSCPTRKIDFINEAGYRQYFNF